jgi:hypothetical protein
MILLFVNRTSTGDDSFSSNIELFNYVNEYFWPRIQLCTIRLTYTLRDANREHKYTERQWIIEVKFYRKKKILFVF